MASAVRTLAGGGSPQLGEPLPIELANATYAVRGQLQEGLRTVEHLGAWLRDMRPRLENPLPDKELLALTEADAAAARELRDAIRSLAQSIVDGSAADATALRVLNRTA